MFRGAAGSLFSVVLCAGCAWLHSLSAHAQDDVAASAGPSSGSEATAGEASASAGSATDVEAAARSRGADPLVPKSKGFVMPPFSIRFDPFTWLIAGRLDLELEVGVWRFISVELVPVLVANTEPPSFDFAGRDSLVSQHSDGLGPIAGFTIGAGFWLFGTPFQGYVARLSLTNVGIAYEATDSEGVFDHVDNVERRLQLFLGSHSRFGFFAVSGGLGLGYELSRSERCFVNEGTQLMQAVTSGCHDEELQITVDRSGKSFADLHGPFYPFYILARFSIGVVFD
jgi:hypothetical protein